MIRSESRGGLTDKGDDNMDDGATFSAIMIGTGIVIILARLLIERWRKGKW